MGRLYYPSCKFNARFPEISGKIQAYLKDSYEVKSCCRDDLTKITRDNTIVYICNSCAAFFEESTPARKVVSIWEVVANDRDFTYPKYENKRMTVQDCWRTYDNAQQQDAIRKILSEMNIEIVEQENARDKTKFCGKALYEPLPKNYDVFAPNRLVKNAQGLFVPRSEEEKSRLMQEHCKTICTEEVVCYCLACLGGISSGGKIGIHLAQCLFS